MKKLFSEQQKFANHMTGLNQICNYLPNLVGPAGVAFGGMARKIIQPWLIEAQKRQISLKDWPEGWDAALAAAKQLINPWLIRKSS